MLLNLKRKMYIIFQKFKIILLNTAGYSIMYTPRICKKTITLKISI